MKYVSVALLSSKVGEVAKIDRELFKKILRIDRRKAMLGLSLQTSIIDQEWVEFIGSWNGLQRLDINEKIRHTVFDLFARLVDRKQLVECSIGRHYSSRKVVSKVLELLSQDQFCYLIVRDHQIMSHILEFWLTSSYNAGPKQVYLMDFLPVMERPAYIQFLKENSMACSLKEEPLMVKQLFGWSDADFESCIYKMRGKTSTVYFSFGLSKESVTFYNV
uniref:FBA_2 domain-containing protein n=1 Tax=Steinernema glaseri TaxID=37863 RepID=A0A1I7Z684_9BILA